MNIIRKIKFLLYRLKWHLAYYFNFKAPLHLDIELTSFCNLNCIFCFRKDKAYKKIKNGFIDFELIETILKEAKEIGVKSIKFNWRGEGTLYYLYEQAISLAHSLGFFIYINTNLSLNYSVNFLEMLASKVDVLKVSFDSINEDIYEEIRKNANFKIVIDNIQFLAELRKFLKKPKLIISRRVANIKGLESNKEFKKYFKDRKIDYIKFDIRPAMKRNQEEIYKNKIINRNIRKYCGHPSRRLVISWNGNVYACCVAYFEQEELYLGNIKEKSLKEIWNSRKRKNLISNLKNNIFNNACLNCTSKDAYK